MGLENKRAAGNRFVRLSLNQLSGIDAPLSAKDQLRRNKPAKKDCPLCSIGGIYR
jgi:hypothetical protein